MSFHYHNTIFATYMTLNLISVFYHPAIKTALFAAYYRVNSQV